jgi:hypothetical protein
MAPIGDDSSTVLRSFQRIFDVSTLLIGPAFTSIWKNLQRTGSFDGSQIPQLSAPYLNLE